MENNNKSQYDWFKGPQAKKQDKDFKQRVKDGFKWAKIFSYVALFTFSMFGCVQVFTITTDNAIGQGLEVYHDEGDIAPSISTTTFAKEFVYSPIGDSGTSKGDQRDAPSYSLVVNPSSSIWINSIDDGNLLAQIHNDVRDTQNVALKDAYKGMNIGFKDFVNSKDTWTYEDVNGDEYTIESDESNTITSVANDIFNLSNDDVDDFNEMKISMNDQSNAMVYSTAANVYDDGTELQSGEKEVDIDFWIPVQTSYTWDSIAEAYKPGYAAINIVIDSNEFDQTEKYLARGKMADDFLSHYLGDFQSDFYNYLASDTEVGAIELAESGLYLNTDDEENHLYENFQQDSQYEQILSGRAFLNEVLLTAAGFDYGKLEYMEYTGGDKDGDDYTGVKLITEVEYQPGEMIGYFGNPDDTKFRPITTWGEAFSLGPFYGFFVYPIGYITSNLVSGMGNLSGWESMMTIFLVVFTIRMLTFALSYKSTMAQSRMQDLNGKKAIIEAKYTQYEGNKQMEMRKRQEVAELYKKNGINPMASLGTMFLTMPFFLAIWRVIGGIPHLKAASWLGITFSATSYQEFFAGQWQYLPLMLIAAGIQLLSQLYPRLINRKQNNERLNAAQKEAMKKSNKTQNITMGVFVFMSVIFTAGIQIYWIIGGLWRIIEVRATHHLKEKDKTKRIK